MLCETDTASYRISFIVVPHFLVVLVVARVLGGRDVRDGREHIGGVFAERLADAPLGDGVLAVDALA